MPEFRILNEQLGRWTHGNPLIAPSGTVKIGKNWECIRDNIYRKPRGRESYTTSLPAQDIAQFLEYQNRLIVNLVNDSLYYDSDGSGTFLQYTGTFAPPETGYKMQSIEQAGNLYFTTSAGVKKLDSLTGSVRDAGVAKGLDYDLRLITGTWFANSKAVAYRHIWAYYDKNSNKVFGAPSARTTIENTSGGAKGVSLRINIPDDITSTYFLEIYRTSIVASGTVPPEDFQLVYQAHPTQADITAGYLTVDDSLPDGFRGAELYTNTTQEGIENANDRPPKANSITKYKGYTFYANVESIYRLYTNLIATSSLTAGTSTVLISDGTNTLTLGCVADVADATVASVADSGGICQLTTTGAHGYTSGDFVRFLDVTGAGGFPDAVNDKVWEVTVTAGTTFTISLAWDAAYTATGGTVDFYEDIGATPRFVISGSGTVSVAVDETARSIVRTINQASGNTTWYAHYESGYDDVVGKMLITTRDLGEAQFFLNVNSTATGSQFSPPIPITSPVSTCADNGSGLVRVTTTAAHGLSDGDGVNITGIVGTTEANGSWTITYVDTTKFDLVGSAFANAYVSDGTVYPTDYKALNDDYKNAIMWSKNQQSEHVPTKNLSYIGSANDEVLAVVGLKDSLFIIKKKDGVYRLTGEADTSFSIDEFDGTVECSQINSIAKGQNAIFMNTTLGYAKVSDIGVEVIGRDNEYKDLLASFSTNFSTDGYGWFYEEEKSYFVAQHDSATSTSNDTMHVYNTFTNCWMQREHGVYTNDPHVKLGKVINGYIYYAPITGSDIYRERKTYTTSDYATAEIANTVSAIDAAANTVTFGSSATIPAGAKIVQGSLTYRVETVNSDSEVVLTTVENLATNKSLTVSTCADNGAGLIRVTTTVAHGLVTDNSVDVAGVVGTTEANGSWVIIRVDATKFDLVDSTFTNAYISGGAVTNALTITPGIVSTLNYHMITCGYPEIEKIFRELNIFLDDDESSVTDFNIKTSTDLDTNEITTPLYEQTTGWGLEPWGTYWGTPKTADRISTIVPEEHARGSYIYFTLIHQRPDEQCAICGLSVNFDPVTDNLET